MNQSPRRSAIKDRTPNAVDTNIRISTLTRRSILASTLAITLTACSGPFQDITEPATNEQPTEQLAYTADPYLCEPLIELGTLSLAETVLALPLPYGTSPELDPEQIVTDFATTMLKSEKLKPADRDRLERMKEVGDFRDPDDPNTGAVPNLAMFNRMADACDAEPTPLYTGTHQSPARDLQSAIDFCQFIENDYSNLALISNDILEPDPARIRQARDSFPVEFEPLLEKVYVYSLPRADPDDPSKPNAGVDAKLRREFFERNTLNYIILFGSQVGVGGSGAVLHYCESINPTT